MISFEEDIAKLVALIVVIAESPGSLAELGAFASISNIRSKLRVIVRQKHADEESFIRFGPIQRVRRDDEGFVGFFPWRINSRNLPIIRSLSPHRTQIIQFIKDHLAKAPATKSLAKIGNSKKFFVVYWIIYVAFAVSPGQIHEITESLQLNINVGEVRNILFCLELVGWVLHESYSGKDYFFSLYDRDPFDYSFNAGVRVTDSVRRKAEISKRISEESPIPKHVRSVVASKRGGQ